MSVQEAYDILTKLHGYTGPETKRAVSNFINARDIPISVKNKGGMIGMSRGGIPRDMIQKLRELGAADPIDRGNTQRQSGRGPSNGGRRPISPDADFFGGQFLPFPPQPVRPQPVEYTAEDIKEGQQKLVGDAIIAPERTLVKPEVDRIDPDTKGTNIKEDAGQVRPDAPKADIAQVDKTAQADKPTATPVTKATTATSADKMKELMDEVDPQTGDVTKEVVGQTKEDTAVSDLDAAQIDTPQTVKDAPTRKIEAGEMIDETPVVDQRRVREETQATAASVQDELSTLMAQFDDGQTPAWAAGSMRKANQMLAARGLGASSLAGQAVIQAAMEAALPIAQLDASNKQQVALANAEQRAKFLQIEFDQAFQTKVMNAAKVSEIANMNFTAQQQIALENARMAQTVDLNNLSNRQALVMAEAAQLSQLELAGLSNLQQAQVQNAQNFLQMDLANLNNEQQTELFKAQQNAQSLLTDTASQNATEQFNASSANQSAQFDANLASQVSQFNTAQYNAMSQFNVNEENALNKFNAEIQNQRDFFNANNSLVVAQANAKWRQDTTTVNTAVQNQANFEFAKQINGLSNKAIDQIWQRERDLMQFAVAQSESALERATRLLLADKRLDGIREQLDTAETAARTSFFGRMLFGSAGLSLFGTKGLIGGLL